MAKTKRIRYTVSHTKEGWTVKRSGKKVAGPMVRKRAAVYAAAGKARWEWKYQGTCTELVIMGVDGQVKDNRTYGRDPRSTKG